MTKIFFTVINDLNYDQRMIRICTSLQNHGYDCELVGRKLPGSKPLLDRIYKQKRLNCWFAKGKLFYLEFNIRLFFYLFFKKWDAICSIDVDTALPGLYLTKWRVKRHIFDAHELFTHVPEVVNRPWVQKIWAWVQKKAFTQTGLAYTVGHEIAKHFEKTYGRRVEVVRNAPSLKNQIPYNPDPDKFILYQGALNVGRGLEVLIEAMPQINARLVLAGEGDLSDSLRQKVQQLGLEQKVTFKGYVLPTDLPLLTSKAYIGMNVSENAGLSYYLSLNNKFFDYIHAGLPSIINPFPEYISLNNQFHVGVITDSVVSNIVQNVNQLLKDENWHRQLSENCLKASLELNWEKEEAHLIDLYNAYFERK